MKGHGNREESSESAEHKIRFNMKDEEEMMK